MMKRLTNARMSTLGAVLWLVSMGALAAQGLSSYLRPDHPDSYTVVKGDTLWDISGRFLERPWLWPDLWRNNPQIQNPHLIYPGDRIFLVWVDGQPHLEVERGDAGRTYQVTPGGTERLEPTVRATPLESAIPAIRLDAIQAFLVQNRVVEPDQLDAAPYILQGDSERLVVGAGDRAYVRGVLADSDRLSVVRAGPIYVDPETGEVLGLEATFIGLGDAVAQDGDVATIRLDQVREEVRSGDRILPTEERRLDAMFYPKAPSVSVSGQIISVFDGVSQVGPYDVVVLNRGSREGLAVGDTLAIHKRGELVRDKFARESVRLPSERAGLLMVFRTFEKLSYGVVLQADRPLAIADEIRNP
jgi:nucleoid-associated protein YgaU